MQSYKYDKAIVPESKNGGSPALNNNPRKGGSKRVLLICLDLFCLFMALSTGPLHLAWGPAPPPPPAVHFAHDGLLHGIVTCI
ncbi:phosphatidic acid phosphatase type 2B, isoform CRA_c [Rattus norvegicus]|uniref:Phosphatidic acid phosphatase type 2B, isoform CRA_c n=1 Tax=Rattus norvegicus TaxID=10116 RepID=A6JRU4_RAT|nr:phosphatidic acid phosphatase type 2B, isoform CRA_c [Rattus norvegicus]